MAAQRIRNIESYDSYFETIVDEATFANFLYYKGEIDQIISDLKSTITSNTFWLEDYEAYIDDRDGDNVLEYKKGAFNIVSPSSAGDFAETQTLIKLHDRQAKKFIARMRKDREDGVLKFDARNFERYKIKNLTSSRLTGIRVEFSIYDTIDEDGFYKESDWQAN